MSTEFFELTTDDGEAWNHLLRRSEWHDFYHRPEYHRLEEMGNQTQARLFVYRQGDNFIAVPLLLRPLPLQLETRGLADATSVYGYAGPILSDPERVDELGPGFRAELRDAMIRHRVVAVFSRLNPLFKQRIAIQGLGECPLVGETVSIDLTLPSDLRVRQYRENHRRDIRRLIASGMRCEVDNDYESIAEFEHLYTETMGRAEAQENYSFDSRYFEQFCKAGDPPPELLVCRVDGRIVCAGLFLREGSVAQYHLSGTASDYHGRAPLKFLIHSAANRFCAEGMTTLHLGGGIGASDDSLLHFKKGFSRARHEFRVWRWIVDPVMYASLAASHRDEGFFPAYRAPA